MHSIHPCDSNIIPEKNKPITYGIHVLLPQVPGKKKENLTKMQDFPKDSVGF
jgi:hypothetical protein